MAKKTLRRRKTKRKTKNNKKRNLKGGGSRYLKGGRCFGNGVGANSNEPNFSIYNTNTLKLFPYKP